MLHSTVLCVCRSSWSNATVVCVCVCGSSWPECYVWVCPPYPMLHSTLLCVWIGPPYPKLHSIVLCVDWFSWLISTFYSAICMIGSSWSNATFYCFVYVGPHDLLLHSTVLCVGPADPMLNSTMLCVGGGNLLIWCLSACPWFLQQHCWFSFVLDWLMYSLSTSTTQSCISF